MNKFVRVISIALTMIMVILTFPVSSVAQTQASETQEELELLLALDNLADATNNVEGSDVTFTPNKMTFDDREGELAAGSTTRVFQEATGDTVFTSVTASKNTCFMTGGITNLPIDGTQKYVIKFKVSLNIAKTKSDHIMGFAFCDGATAYWERHTNFITVRDTKLWNNVFGGGSNNGVNSGEQVAETTVLTGDVQEFSIIIDRENVYFTDAVGKHLFEWKIPTPETYFYDHDFQTSGVQSYLTLGCFVQLKDAVSEMDLASMSDVRVYRSNAATSIDDLKLVLSLDNLTDGTNNVEGSSVTFAPGTLVEGTKSSDDNVTDFSAAFDGDRLFIGAETSANNGCSIYGGQTNLPLNQFSKYTITFEASLPAVLTNENNRMGFAFCTGAAAYWGRNTNFIIVQNQTICCNVYGGAAANGVCSGSAVYDGTGGTILTAEKQIFSIVIYEGYVTLLNSDGVNMFSWMIPNAAGYFYDHDSQTNGVQSYLTLGAFVQDYAKPDSSNGLATMSDIKVYEGAVDTRTAIDCYGLNGEKLGSLRKGLGEMVEAFPNVTPENPNNIIRWFYKDTNVVVNLPMKVVCETAVEAREIECYSTKIAGVQNTTSMSDKQSVRFLATLHTLQISCVGFEVEAKYMNNNTLTTKTWNKESTTVYSSIAANENGTVKSIGAAELGGTYIIALSVDSVPTNIGQIDFYVRSYVEIDGEKIYSETVTFSYINGVANASAELLVG